MISVLKELETEPAKKALNQQKSTWQGLENGVYLKGAVLAVVESA